MTRDEIAALKVGDVLERTIDTCRGKALPGARYAFRGAITRIYARGINTLGQAYIQFFTRFGPVDEMSGMLREGEEYARQVEARLPRE